jgi:small conductance mechanosensitive channel
MLVENQVRVNDVAIINGTGGLVEELNLRTTVLRSQDGAVHIFPNGSITTLSNLTREFSHYVFDIRIPYGEDTDRAIAALQEVADQVQSEEPYRSTILAPLEVLGVEQLAESAVVIRARVKTMPIQQWAVGREMNRRIKRKFEELGIAFAAPRLNVTMNFSDPASRTALKTAIREVLREELGTRSAGVPHQ